MAGFARMVVIGGAIGLGVAGGLAGLAYIETARAQDPPPQAEEAAAPSVGSLFSAPAFDPRVLRKFDIAVADSVSNEVERTDQVAKIAFGRKSVVTIVTTPTGVYSNDAMLSPNVRYPGIDVTRKDDGSDVSVTTYLTPYGTATWSSFSSGSFTYLTYSFKPAARTHV